jgi:hypothetical protein
MLGVYGHIQSRDRPNSNIAWNKCALLCSSRYMSGVCSGSSSVQWIIIDGFVGTRKRAWYCWEIMDSGKAPDMRQSVVFRSSSPLEKLELELSSHLPPGNKPPRTILFNTKPENSSYLILDLLLSFFKISQISTCLPD